MGNSTPFVLAGLGIGSVLGLSTGVAAGGDAVNGVFIFGPIGAIIGWLFARRGHLENTTPKTVAELIKPTADVGAPKEGSMIGEILHAVLVFFASLWNAHIYLLQACKILPSFVRQPWLFFALGMIVAVPFPPFLGVYFLAYLGAAHFGISGATNYRANIT